MSKVTKKELQYQINGLAAEASTRHNSIMRIHRALASIGVDIFSDDFDLTEPEPQPQPQLKKLDQSIFDDEPPHLRWAAIEEDGSVYLFAKKPFIDLCKWAAGIDEVEVYIGDDYDTSNWQNSLIERDIAKELLEIDLSSGLRVVIITTAI